jgi:hypothetical protein
MGGTTPKVMCRGYDEPTHALHGFGLTGPEVPAPLKTFASVASKRMLLQSALSNLMRGTGSSVTREITAGWNWRRCHVNLHVGKDPIICMRDLRGSLWYASRRGEAYKTPSGQSFTGWGDPDAGRRET